MHDYLCKYECLIDRLYTKDKWMNKHSYFFDALNVNLLNLNFK